MDGLCRIPKTATLYVKRELFNSTLSRWVLTHGGSLPIDRANPSPSSIKTAIDMLQHGEIILIFPSGTRSEENIAFKRGAATIALHARFHLCRLLSRPKAGASHASPAPTSHPGDIRVTDPNSGSAFWKATTIDLTRQLQEAIGELRSIADTNLSAPSLRHQVCFDAMDGSSTGT